MNLSNLVILLFTLVASTSAAALIAGIDENEVTQLQKESLAVEEPSKDVFGEHFSNVNKRSTFHRHSDSHRHRFLGHRRHSYHRHRYHPYNRYSGSYTHSQMNSPTAYTGGKRFFSHRHHPFHFHHGHGHRSFYNRHHQVTTEAPSELQTTTTKADPDRSREDLIKSIFEHNDSKIWDNLLEPITDSPLKLTTNSKGLLYDIDPRSSF